MKVVSFRPEHLDMIDPVGGGDLFWMAAKQLRDAEKAGQVMAATMIDGETIYAIAGIYNMWPGVGEAFSLMGKGAYRYPVSMCKLFKRTLSTFIEAGGYWRVHATVRFGFGKGVRFLEYLGFVREGLMKKWGPDGADTYLYAIVRQ